MDRNCTLYRESTDTKEMEKIIIKKIAHCDGEPVKHRFILKKEAEKEKIVGYTDGKCDLYAPYNLDALVISDKTGTYYSPVYAKKKLGYRVVGYIATKEGQYVGLLGSLFPILLLLLLLLLLCTVCMLPKKPQPKIPNAIKISENTIPIDHIPTSTPPVNNEMAYITGQNINIVTGDQPYLFLQNDKENEKYLLLYEVYLGEEETPAYTSEMISCGQAETWDAYHQSSASEGENTMWYKVFVYDLNGELLATTTVDGLKLVKQ